MRILTVLIFFLAIGCQTTKPKPRPCPECPKPEICPPCEKPDDMVLIVPFQTLKPTFEDGTKVKKTWDRFDGKAWYHYREGHTRVGDCRISKTPIERTGDGLIFMRMNGATETCSGKNCSHCVFKKGGGCDCKNSLNICEHTITRNRDLMRLL